MAIKSIFGSVRGKLLPKPDAINHEGSRAYRLDPRTALAQLAATGCFGNTFYVSGEEQLAEVLAQAGACSPLFVAQVAIFARERGYMKDMPALLLAHLSTRGPEGTALMKRAFSRVIDNARMLRNFVQIVRSGQLGRKSLGSAPKAAVRAWLAARPPSRLLADSVGNDPSLADIVKMVHPKPVSDTQRATYGYLLRRAHQVEHLPENIRAYEAWMGGDRSRELPSVPFQLLDNLPLDNAAWITIAKRAGFHETRMNLNTYARHGVFADRSATEVIAGRLASAEAVRSARVFPYQLMTTWKQMHARDIPSAIQDAVQTAMEHALANVPELPGKIVICPDVSGSMAASAVTGSRTGATSVVRCIDVAGLVSAALLRKNRDARVLPFETTVRDIRLNPRDSVLTIATQLAQIGGGGTNCSAPLAKLNRDRAEVDLVIFVSDNESWVDAGPGHTTNTTATLVEWTKLRTRNPRAKLVCIDLTPNTRKQAIDRPDIMNIGGFSDVVFELIERFAKGEHDAEYWANSIAKIEV